MQAPRSIVPARAGAASVPPRPRKSAGRFLLGALLCALFVLPPAAVLRAETGPPTPPATETPDRKWTREEIDTLTGRIALHPDALVAQILPASTFPLQIVEAGRWLEAKKSVAEGDKEPWDQSVKALLRYPTVLRMMSENLRWTEELGNAFAAQPEDVLQSIQRLRRQARALGNLQDSPRQRIVVDPDQIIVIAPPAAEPDLIYVPIYDPAFVFIEPPPPGGFWVSFDVGYPLGVWIGTGVSWTAWHIVYGGWGFDWGWGSVYGGCCRGGVYNYTPTVINRRLTINNAHYWRPRYTAEHRRPPVARSQPPRRPSAQDISRGRMPPRTAPGARPDVRTTARPPAFRNIERGTNTLRNADRGRLSLGTRRTAPGAAPPTRTTPPARYTPPVPPTRPAMRREQSYSPRSRAPSPGFTPRPQRDIRSFTTRGNTSRATMPPRVAPRTVAPPRSAPPPRQEKPRSAPTPSRGESPRRNR